MQQTFKKMLELFQKKQRIYILMYNLNVKKIGDAV